MSYREEIIDMMNTPDFDEEAARFILAIAALDTKGVDEVPDEAWQKIEEKAPRREYRA